MKSIYLMPFFCAAILVGCGDKGKPQNVSNESSNAAREVVNSRQDERVYNIHPLNLGYKYNSNPFEIRNGKALGKTIQTEIFAGSYVDEGVSAKIQDDNFGVFCRMSGAEYSKSPVKRGYLVVKGVLVEEAGKLGLNNCLPASDQGKADWRDDPKADDYNSLIN